jgi:hypothetical protein
MTLILSSAALDSVNSKPTRHGYYWYSINVFANGPLAWAVAYVALFDLSGRLAFKNAMWQNFAYVDESELYNVVWGGPVLMHNLNLPSTRKGPSTTAAYLAALNMEPDAAPDADEVSADSMWPKNTLWPVPGV